jgi:hypothetical protein
MTHDMPPFFLYPCKLQQLKYSQTLLFQIRHIHGI